MQQALGILEAAVVGGAYWGKVLVKPEADKLREWLWRVPGGLWRVLDSGALRPAAVTAAGTPAAEAAVRRACDPIAAVDPVTAGLTVVNGIEPLWGPLTRDPVAGLSLQSVGRATGDGEALEPSRQGLLWVRWAGGTSISRVNAPPATPLPGSRELDSPGLPVLASLHDVLLSAGGSRPKERSAADARWLVPADDLVAAANVLEREQEDQEASSWETEQPGGETQERDGSSSPDEADGATDEAEAEDGDEPGDPAAAACEVQAAGVDAAAAPAELGGFQAPLRPGGAPLTAEAAVRRCRALIDTDTPLAASSLGFVRALRQVMLTQRGKTAATTMAKEELTAAVGTWELHGVPENGVIGSMWAAASSARSGVHARREAARADPSLLRATAEFIAGRPGDSSAVGLRQKLILRSSRLTRHVRKKASSLLARTPGAGRLAGTLAAATSFTSSVTAAMLGDDPLPPSAGVLSALAVLFDGVPSLPAHHPHGPAARGRIKGSVPGDLASRLAVLASRMRGPRGIAVVWNAFVTELQSRWDRRERLPHMPAAHSQSAGSKTAFPPDAHIHAHAHAPPTPDLQMGLLSQKLGMLQWCIASLSSGPITSPSAAGTTKDLLEEAISGGTCTNPLVGAGSDEEADPACEPGTGSEAAAEALTAGAATPKQNRRDRLAEELSSPATDDSMHTAHGAPDEGDAALEDADGDGWEVSGLGSLMSPVPARETSESDPISRANDAAPAVREEPQAAVGAATVADTPAVAARRAGAKRALPGMRLLQSGLQMMEPHTQVAVAFTEDTLRERQDLMARVGSLDGSSALLAKTHVAGLRSDMSAFKAANPTCCFGDFIRWYSPNDWVQIPPGGRAGDVADEEMTVRADATDTRGMLSTRFAAIPPVVPGVDDAELGSLGIAPLETAAAATADAEAASCRYLARRQAVADETGCLPDEAADGAAAAARGGSGPRLETLWLETWRQSPPLAAANQEPVVPVEFQGTLALDYLQQLPMQDLLVLLFAVSASNSAHVLQNAAPAAIALSAQCRAKLSTACACLRRAASTASDFVLAEFTPETVASAASRPIAARHHVNRGLRERLGRVIGDACIAVCTVADAETALSRFVAVSHHLDAWQSASSIAWRTASALLSRPQRAHAPSSPLSSPSSSSSSSTAAAAAAAAGGGTGAPASEGSDEVEPGAAAQELLDSTKAAAILCGGYMPPTQLAAAEGHGSSELCAARVAADSLREDAAFFPESCRSAYGCTSTSFLVPPVPVADPTHPTSSFLWSTHSHLDLGLDDPGDDEQAFEDANRALDDDLDAADHAQTAGFAPRLGSILRAGTSRQAIQQLRTALQSIPHEIHSAALPSQRLCALLRLSGSETALADTAPVIVDTPADADADADTRGAAKPAARREATLLGSVVPAQPTSALEIHIERRFERGAVNHVSAVVSDSGTRMFAAVTETV